ncbi:MAG TPA: 4Fe-4S dicluster domain-containing protein [Stellaceae bacterium]|nr:4Fe-4S dicluster domain-containing protein [Stellaceae bacterium]
MPDQRTLLVCSCDDTMPLDSGALARGCAGVRISQGRQLCRAELDRFRTLAAAGLPLTVGCTQEASLFREVAGDRGSELTFVNLRESAGWSDEAAQAGPKMAALAAAAALPMPDISFVPLESGGVILVYGHDEEAIEAANQLKDHLDVTVLLTRPEEVTPPRVNEFPIVQGKIRTIKGHFGAFEIVVDDYATALPSSRGALRFGPARNGATSHCDIVLDLSGGAPLFSAGDLRDGYLRADPRDRAATLAAVLRARDLVGGFDKPRYVAFTADLCAHSRSNIVGCHRCLDLCPAGAITPDGDHVAIDEKICAGCGQCAAACPTGAAGYALPPADALIGKLRTLLMVYREAGGTSPVMLFHDEAHGGALIDALARHGDGLPANVLPFAVNEVTQIGLEAVAAAFAYGSTAVRVILRERPRHDLAGLRDTIALATPILAGLGFSGEPLATIETDDPFVLGAALRTIEPGATASPPADFLPVGGKRDVQRFALSELHRVAPAPSALIELPAGAPFGAVEIDVAGCTLCLSCVSACPTGALSDDPDRPVLRFSEAACIQCGLCKATCPEKVVSLVPRLAFGAAANGARVLKEEEPYPCVRCGKPFGVRSTIERVVAKLEGAHWMYRQSSARLDLIRMCDDCRVAAVTEQGFDPHAGPARPRLRTTDDYLREREKKPEE